MKAAFVKGRGRFVIEEVPDPVPNKDEVVVRVKYCGICGSDLHIYEAGAEIGAGHEFSGDIVAIGSEVRGWKVGQRVAVEPRIACGECHWCTHGRVEICDEYYTALLNYKGAFASFAKTKYTHVHRIPDSMSYQQAALIEPTTCALHAVRMSSMQQGDLVAVLGLGTIGQLVARIAKVYGAHTVYATEISQSRINAAIGEVDEVINVQEADPVKRIFELTDGKGVDIVFECAGSTATSQQSIATVGKGGTIIVVGICYDWVTIPFSSIMLKELTIKGSICFSEGEYAAALEMIRNGQVNVEQMVTHIIPLNEINEAFEMASRGEGVKILIQP